ncbi:MAG: site-specific integrase [Paraprevotella sp.]|nr:site-specific integrase [Paraprevotella sp.]
MASVKVKFRPSTVSGKEGTVYYQIIHNRVIRRIKTDFRIFKEEWDAKNSRVALVPDAGRAAFLLDFKERMAVDVKRLNTVIRSLEGNGNEFTAEDIVEKYHESVNMLSFFQFMEGVIGQLKRLNKERTAENYTAALNSFMHFRNHNDVLLDEIDFELMMEYEAYLKAKGITMNTTSFYMRILRAVYNRAVEKELTVQCRPFRRVYTGVDKTVKRAVSLKTIKLIKDMDLSQTPSLDFARDIFMFSFYTRGISFVDMAYFKKKDLQGGVLSYRRRKTGQQLFVKWEKCMQEVVDKYQVDEREYLLPIIRTAGLEQRQYRNVLRFVNNNLKKISVLAGLQPHITMYVSRHSWASAAKSKNVPLAVICESMGHDSETTTLIYLASLDSSLIDQANEMILKKL